MANPLVSIIILTYKNGFEDIKKCINSLNKISYKPFEIILIDNGSTDNTVDYVKKYFPKVRLIENKKNMGFCTGNNQGAKAARGKYILLFNNDAIATTSFLTELVHALESDEKLGVVQPKIRQLKNKNKLDACASFLTSTGFLYHYGYSQNQQDKRYNKEIYMYSAKGACFLTRKSLIDKIGLFDDNYFAYFEDTDFCHRTWLNGYRVEYVPESVIFHLGGIGKQVSAFIQYHSFKNRIYTYLKNLETQNLLKILAIHIPICFTVAIMYLANGKFSYSLAIMRALGWNFINFPKTFSKRRIVQGKIRKVRDADMLPYITKGVRISYYKHFFFTPRGVYDFEEI